MLYTQLVGSKLQNRVGVNLGVVKDLVFDPTDGRIIGAIVSAGFRKPNQLYPLAVSNYDTFDRLIVLENSLDPTKPPEYSSLNRMFGKDLIGSDIYSPESERIGRAYNFVIGTQLQEWMVWKVLIRVGLKKRRERVSYDDLQFQGGKIVYDIDGATEEL